MPALLADHQDQAEDSDERTPEAQFTRQKRETSSRTRWIDREDDEPARSADRSGA
jgi:hypothetical protein